MSAEERDTEYKCTIIDFSLAHKSSKDAIPTQAFRLQEMGVDPPVILSKCKSKGLEGGSSLWCGWCTGGGCAGCSEPGARDPQTAGVIVSRMITGLMPASE